MKKLIGFLCAAFLTVSVIGQITKNHSGFFSKVSKQKELSFPGINDSFLNFHNQKKSAKQQFQLKEANGLKQRLDSLLAPGSDKSEYVYDASGNLIRETYFYWDGMWLNSGKEESAYNANGDLTQEFSYDWDGIQWLNSYKDEYSYDSNRNQTKFESYGWDGSKWVDSYKRESVYDNNNNLTQTISFYQPGFPDNTWTATDKNEYAYDSNGNQTQNIRYNWSDNKWGNSSKTEYVFSANEIITQIIEYYWNGENWLNAAKYEYVYAANQDISEFVYYEWYSMESEWIETAKYLYEYDANGNRTLSKLIYFAGDENFTFVKEESVYDDFGNQISYSYYGADFENGEYALLPMIKQERDFDNSFSFEDLILPFNSGDFEAENETDFEGEPGQFDLNQMFKHKLVGITTFVGDGQSWVLQGDYTIYYSEQNITGAEDLNVANNVIVYPNPATNLVTFDLGASVNQFTVEFYDTQGKLVENTVSGNNQAVSIESLHKGLYFYRLSEKQNLYTGKIMVK